MTTKVTSLTGTHPLRSLPLNSDSQPPSFGASAANGALGAGQTRQQNGKAEFQWASSSYVWILSHGFVTWFNVARRTPGVRRRTKRPAGDYRRRRACRGPGWRTLSAGLANWQVNRSPPLRPAGLLAVVAG